MIAAHLRHAARSLRKTPAFTAAAVLSLALAIGANTAIFSVANALLLRPLPYRAPDRLVILWNRSPGLNITQDWFSTAQYFDIRGGHSGFDQLAIAIGGAYSLTGTGEPERIGAIRVSSGLLPMLGATAVAGRLFSAADDAPGAAPSAVLTHGAWTRRFGAAPSTVGRRITLNGEPYTITGVLPRGFALPREVLPTLGSDSDPEIFLPLPLNGAAATFRGREDYNILGTLKPGVPLARAQAEMDALTARLRRDHPEVYPPNSGLTFSIVPLIDQVVGDSRRPVLILSAAVACVLLIACANIANLLLARALARSREMAIRSALGATRGVLIRQLLTESLALALPGGVLGILTAAGLLRAIRLLGPASVPRLESIEIDTSVLLFSLTVSLAAGILFGLAPALRASHPDLHTPLKGGRNSLRGLLAACELALSIVLLIGAGLLLRSFARLADVPPGFDPRGVLTMGVSMNTRRYGGAQTVRDTYRALWERIESAPGVTVGAVSALPFSALWSWGPITIEGRVPPPGENFINADQRIAAAHYFETMRIPLKAGRLFNQYDTADAPRVAVIDERMARDYWPGGDAIGKRFRTGGADSKSPWITVVGVVGRVKQYALDADDRIALYLSHTQYPTRAMSIVTRGVSAQSVRTHLRALDPDIPVYQVRTMEDRVAESLARRRFTLVMLGAFALLSLVLAAIGIYGVMSYLVTQSTKEIGIRMALGASTGKVFAFVLRRGMSIAAAGLAAGMIAAYPLTRLMQTLLYAIQPTDLATFAAAAVILMTVALIACYLPARRAAKVDPLVSLRT
jgi:predicted permease